MKQDHDTKFLHLICGGGIHDTSNNVGYLPCISVSTLSRPIGINKKMQALNLSHLFITEALVKDDIKSFSYLS